MKVIFMADVPNVAKVGQTKEVAGGYARNFLFPRKLAVLADSQSAVAMEAHLKKLVRQRELEEAEMAELAKRIGGLQITLTAKVGENDKLYGSITGADIAEALSKAASCAIDKKNIALPEPIKQAGACDVTVRFGHDIQAVIKVNVVSEEAAAAPAQAEKKPEKAETAEAAAPKKEKAEKKEKKEKKPKEEKAEEKPAAEPEEEKPAKPAKKAKAEKPPKEEKPAAAEAGAKAEEKKEKKSRAKQKEDKAAE